MAKKNSRALFSCKVQSFRRQDIPGTKDGKASTAYVRVSDLLDAIDFDKWMDVNPRVPKRTRKGLLTGHVISGIWRTLRECPEDFALKNLGLYLLAESVDHDRGTDIMTISLTSPEKHGLCNGGHTYAALRAFAEREDTENELDNAYVRIQILEKIDESKVVEIAEGLNRSRQVDDASLDDLRKNFEIIKRAMRNKPGEREIGYHMGDTNDNDQPCAYYITEIIRYLMFFNAERYDANRHPHDLYRYQKKTMDFFRQDVDGPMNLVCKNTPKILRLWHCICLALPDAKVGTRRYRRMEVKPRGKNGGVKTVGSVKTTLHFIEDEVDCAILNGWVMPMLAAFRANVDWDLETERFEWKIDPDEIIPHVIGEFYRICAEAHDNGRKPDEVGRDGSVYSQMYDKVDQFLMRQELELAREQIQKLQKSKS